MITVNTNMSSIIAQNSLYKSTNKMNTALQRLSTGLRINSAKDDAAGSAVSTKLEYKISSYDVAKDNAQMGQSMLDTASGSLGQINSMLQRMRDLSEQAANGTYGNDEKKAMQSEIDALTEEIYRIKNTTEFNGKKIFGEEEKPSMTSVPTMSINNINLENLTQAEWDSNYKGQVFGISNAKELQKLATIVNDKKINTSDTTFALTADIDLDELGDIDGNGSNWVAIGNQDLGKSFVGIFDGNGHTISNLKINNPKDTMQGLFGFVNGSTIKNLNINNVDIISNKAYTGSLCGKINHSTIENCNVVSSKITGNIGTGGFIGEANTVTIKNSSIENSNIKINGKYTISGGFIGVLYTSDSSFTNIYCDVKLENPKNYSVGAIIGKINKPIKSINNCYYNEEINGKDVPAVNTSLTSTSAEEYSKMFKASTTNPFIPQEIEMKTNLQVGINSDANSTITVDTGFSLNDLNISVLNEFSARNSLDKIDAMMKKVMAKMTEIGATQSRLENIMEFQEIQKNALTSANSLIKDADIALESANYLKNQILQNVTSALLSTANQSPQIALQLI